MSDLFSKILGEVETEPALPAPLPEAPPDAG
jgi:hypothetical protein